MPDICLQHIYQRSLSKYVLAVNVPALGIGKRGQHPMCPDLIYAMHSCIAHYKRSHSCSVRAAPSWDQSH